MLPLIPIKGHLTAEKVEAITNTFLDVLNSNPIDSENRATISVSPQTGKSQPPILLYFDSPGGAVDNVKELADLIHNAECLTIGLIGNYCTSAAYWLASQCDQLWALTPTARIGGAGAMISYLKESDNIKEVWGEEIEIYAPQSTRKNEEYNALKNGDPEPYKKNILAPLAEILIADVLRGREGRLISPTDDALSSGVTLYATEALGRGWIDQILPTRRAIPSAVETYMREHDMFYPDNQKQTEMQTETTTANTPTEQTPHAESTPPITEEQTPVTEATLPVTEQPPTNSEAYESIIDALNAKVDALNAKVAEMETRATEAEALAAERGVAPVSGVGMVRDSPTDLVAYCEANADNPLAVIAAIRTSRTLP